MELVVFGLKAENGGGGIRQFEPGRRRWVDGYGAHNLPTKFTLQVNRQAVKYRRVGDGQIVFTIPRKRLGRGAKSVTVVAKQNAGSLFVIRINLRDGSYRVI